MIFSVCHATARPNGWQASAKAWFDNALNKNLDYVLGIDERWGFESTYKPNLDFPIRAVWNTGRKCSVDNWNIAITATTGSIIILNSDDMFPPKHWDHELLKIIPNIDSDFVVQVSSGTHADDRNLMVLGILSRTRYNRLGYAYYPEYTSMACDDDFGEHAKHDNVIIKASHLIFEHRHALFRHESYDAVYQHQNSSDAVKLGDDILARRRRDQFSR